MTKDEMAAVLKKFDIKSPLTNNALTEPIGKIVNDDVSRRENV